jgi:aldehyde:ferredoxin oxidoreductase
VRVISNEKLKGKGSLETEGMIKEALKDEHSKVATIGVAGENSVRFACVNSDWGRNSGRTGMGAVMGSRISRPLRRSKDLPISIYKLKVSDAFQA